MSFDFVHGVGKVQTFQFPIAAPGDGQERVYSVEKLHAEI
jgi:hypothetical protein